MDPATPRSYAIRFPNTGLGEVRETEGTKGEKKIEYVKTDPRGIGDIFTGAVIDYSLRHPETSLVRLLGSSSSRGHSETVEVEDSGTLDYKNRAPAARIKIFWELLTRDLPIRQADLEAATGISASNLKDHIRLLKRDGVVSADTPEWGDEFGRHKKSDSDVEVKKRVYRGEPTTYAHLVEIFEENPNRSFGRKELIELIIARDPQFEWLRNVNSIGRVSHLLSELVTAGFLVKENYTREDRSKIWLTDEQRASLQDFVDMLDKIQNLDPEFVAYANRRGAEIISNPQNVSTLLSKAKDASASATPIPSDELQGMIKGILGSSQQSLNTATILKSLYDQGVRISDAVVENTINFMASQGELSNTIEKDCAYWFVKSA